MASVLKPAMQAATIFRLSPFHRLRREDWLTLLLATAPVVVVVWSVENAAWVAAPSLPTLAIMGAFAGFIFTRKSTKMWLGILAGVALGALVVYLQAGTLSEVAGPWARVADVNSRLAGWWQALVDGDINTDVLPFAIILSALAWTAGYLAALAVFRRGNLWLAILPSAFGLFMNLTYLPDRFYVHLFPFMLATMLLVAWLSFLQRRRFFENNGIGYPASMRTLWMVGAAASSAAIVGLSFLMPSSNIRHEGLKQVWNTTRQPAEWFEMEFGRLFSGVGNKDAETLRRFSAAYPILYSAPVSDEPVFTARSTFPAYWRVRSYTTYTSGGWSTDSTTTEPARLLEPQLPQEDEEALGPVGMSYTIEVASSVPYLYVPSSYLYSVNLPAQVETHRESPYGEDMISVRPKRRLGTGQAYVGISKDTLYAEEILRSAGQTYPQWAKDRYLKLPPALPQRVKDLAQAITRRAAIPYDKARAIEDYLRAYRYTATSIASPSFDQDRVDHFLFDSKAGNSAHFSSSMAVMLRAVGIPARLVTGYGPGEFDEESGAFVIKERHQHSWPEAFFPNLGWVEFEPSPIYDLLPRSHSERFSLGPLSSGSTLEQLLEEQLAEQDTVNSDNEGEGNIGGRLPGGFGGRPFPLVDAPSPLGMAGVLLLTLAGVWVAVLWWAWRRFVLALPRPELAYQRMCRMAGLMVASQVAGQTPLEVGRALASALPEVRQDIAIICDAYSRSTYGRWRMPRGEAHRLKEAWTSVKKAMVRRALR